jgi:signal transduction histidine kinase
VSRAARTDHRGPITAARLGLSVHSLAGEVSAARLLAIDTELGRATLALDDLAELQGGEPRLRRWERVDLAAVIEGSVEAWQASAEAAGVTLAAAWNGAGVSLWADRLRLAQAVGNLIANAVEHGAGPVEVHGGVRAGWVRIEVGDAGPGLPAPVAELTRRARRGRGARGRGLAIASAIAAAHGGRLAGAPSDGGARLVLELPLGPGGLSAS